MNERKFTVAALAPNAKRRFIYEYDFGEVNKLLEAPVKDQEQGIKVTEESCPLRTVRITVRVWDEKVTALSRERRGH